MMNVQLSIGSMLERAEKYFPKKEIVSRTQKKIHRLTYEEIGRRTRQLAHALKELGVAKGERGEKNPWSGKPRNVIVDR